MAASKGHLATHREQENSSGNPLGPQELEHHLSSVSEKLPDWNNLDVIHRNTLPPRSTFYIFDNEEDALSRDITKSKTQCLSGIWKFGWRAFVEEPTPAFYAPDYPSESGEDIEVPGMWQLQGHGKGPQYTNIDYPWPVDPPFVLADDNETGYYIRKFQLPESFKDHQLRLRFEGVDSSFHVWVNGAEMGYSQGSRNPSEWDITSFVDFERPNTLAVRVYQRCNGSYIEDQDEWWLSGIFRDVNILAFPKIHVNDFRVETSFDNDYSDAVLKVTAQLSGESRVDIKLLDAEFKLIAKDHAFAMESKDFETVTKINVKKPYHWTAETPYLYHVVLSVGESQVIAQRIGFRDVKISKGLLRVNGQPIVIRGVNRHEHHPTRGRAVPYEFMRDDLLLMKAHNINAIRTCHQINDPRMYDVADELGLWILDEADLECHGFGVIGGNAASYASDNPAWRDSYLDRAKQLVMRDKNHACVIIWSLGNESFFGQNHVAMYNWIKGYDKSRPVHYEADYSAGTVDMFSRMYTPVDQLINFATGSDTWDKPLILCEFAHSMGNGPGGLQEYVDAFYKYPRLQGGFVWEWSNHGLWKEEPGKKGYFAYGGDFGDDPHDNHFCMDGIIDSNHRPGAGLATYKKVIEPVQVLVEKSTPNKIIIINRYDFRTLDHLKCEYSIISEGRASSSRFVASIPKGVKPGQTAALFLGALDLAPLLVDDVFIEISFSLREATTWVDAGHEVAWGQIPVKKTGKASFHYNLFKRGNNTYAVSTLSNRYIFYPTLGTLAGWYHNSTNILFASPALSFYRALTDNESPNDGREWKDRRVHQAKPHVKSFTITTQPHPDPSKTTIPSTQTAIKITVHQRIAPPVFAWSIDTITTYTITSSGLTIHVTGTPSGNYLPRTLARIGLDLPLIPSFNSVRWFGRGPGPSYPDMKAAQRFGNWQCGIDELWVDYEFPQEGGNRGEVRWVEFLSEEKEGEGEVVRLKADFGRERMGAFNACHYRTEDVDNAQHAYELEDMKRDEVYARLDWATAGIGSGSCGPKTTAEYEVRSEPFEFEVHLSAS